MSLDVTLAVTATHLYIGPQASIQVLCSVLYCDVVCYRVLWWWCGALQYVAVVLRCVAVCCTDKRLSSAKHCNKLRHNPIIRMRSLESRVTLLSYFMIPNDDHDCF